MRKLFTSVVLFFSLTTVALPQTIDLKHSKGTAKDAVSTPIPSPAQKKLPEVINGYMLPPEPDETINNSTLLGVDFNGNGVRDDMERKIVNAYQTPIKIELMLAYARSHQEMLHDPIGSAIASQKKMQKATNCNMYLIDENLAVENIVEFTENNMYNTKERVKVYLDFNKALSGGVYRSGPSDWNAKACDFDVEEMLKDKKKI